MAPTPLLKAINKVWITELGKHYLQYAESGRYFIIVGVDAPENLFAYEDFDATPNVFDLQKSWSPHAQDFDESAAPFLWKGD